MLRKNVAGQFIYIQGVDASTGGIKSGVTWTMRRCLDGTFAAGGATITEDSTNGWYKVALAQADTNGNDIGYNFTGTGAIPITVNVITTAADPTDGVRFGLTALPNVAQGNSGQLPTADSSGRVTVITNSDKTGYGLATDAISAAAVSAAGGNKIADIVMRRNSANIEASANGDTLSFESPYGAVAKLTNKVTVSGSNLLTTKVDGTTTLGTQALSVTPGADPITTVGQG